MGQFGNCQRRKMLLLFAPAILTRENHHHHVLVSLSLRFAIFHRYSEKKTVLRLGESIKYAIDWRQPNKNFGHMAYSWAWGRLIAPRYSLFQAMINEPWQSFNRSDFKMSRVSQKSGQNRLICWLRSARGCGFSGSPAERVPYLKLLYSCTHFWKNMPTDLLICTNSSSHTHSLTHRYTHTHSQGHTRHRHCEHGHC